MIGEAPERLRKNACGEKRKYITRKTARRAKKIYQYDFRGDKMEVYLCPYCEFYHLGHKMGSPKSYQLRLQMQV